MIEKNADEFVVASEITVNARAGIVRVRLAEQQQELRGQKARELLASISTAEDFDRI